MRKSYARDSMPRCRDSNPAGPEVPAAQAAEGRGLEARAVRRVRGVRGVQAEGEDLVIRVDPGARRSLSNPGDETSWSLTFQIGWPPTNPKRVNSFGSAKG